MKLLIISSVIHYENKGRIYAYGPYAREIEIWADLFDELTIAAPVRRELPASDATELERPNIRIVAQKEVGGETVRAKLRILWNLPALCFSLVRAMAYIDALHIRCPGNLGFLGILLGPWFCRHRIAKYAGQWDGFPGEPLTVRLQRWILGSSYWGAPVTVYGHFPDQPNHVISCFTSIMSQDQLEVARAATEARGRGEAPVILYTGRLSAAKNVDIFLESLAGLRQRSLRFKALIVGAGPEEGKLRQLAERQGLSEVLAFTGGLPHREVLRVLSESHILVLGSETEGWPKSLAEAMAHGLVCIGSNRGLIPFMLSEGRGFTVPVRDAAALTEILGRIVADYESHRQIGVKASGWARQYSLESLKEFLRNLMLEHWRVPGLPPVLLRAPGNEAPSS